ncbi:MAG: valine--tRNA ligase, partial [Leptospirales bacterium]|nr:valine--tRNA ligase [Leptospirales bacterium]
MELAATFEPREAEEKWYAFWETNGYFHANENDTREPFCIVIPPPNVTGSLHMGHALNNTLQDILARWQRMNGKSVLWMPGMDHAGIATQNVVERLIREEGLAKEDLGREKFQERVWQWKEKSGGQIKGQLKRLGSSLDWQRERFTLDDGLSQAVRGVFKSLYDENLVYQGYRIINWCPRCETALSDIETEYKNIDGHFWHIKYPLPGSDDYIVVATTRPETMLGDTGIAINPEDERYAHLIGRKAALPLVNREIPIFADSYIDKEFGTGIVKVTPAHDPNDFEMGKRHSLEEVNIMDSRGFINENGGAYKGLDRFEARKKIVADLDAAGLLVKVDNHAHSVGHCYRCQTVIEPRLSKQWFVKIKPLAEKAIEAVKSGDIRFVPQNWEKTYFEWMNNIRDWCISRQLWWGHRIPAYYCADCEAVMVELEEPQACASCGSGNVRQDEDVLDTWFSSGLWPFSTLGWPEHTGALKKYYPTSVLVTAFDIIFFWVARMIMFGLKFMDNRPFKDIYIHALIRDEEGQKMSKSKGNVIDPLTMMDQYGTDAFRFTLAAFAAQGRDIVFSEKRVVGYRTFINKIWQASRFVLMNIEPDFKQNIDAGKLEMFDRWILARFNKAVRAVDKSLSGYRFNDMAQEIYDFWWHEFCDWYIELVKQRLYTKEESSSAARQVLFYILKNTLKLMHPVMPFITEEIWSNIKEKDEPHIITASWPEANPAFDFEAESDKTELFKEAVYKIRNIRGEMNIAPDIKANVVFKTNHAEFTAIVNAEIAQLKALAKLENIIIDPAYIPDKTDASAVMYDIEIYMPLKGLIDFGKERARLEKEFKEALTEFDKVT